MRRSAVQVLFQLAEKGDKRDARFDRSKIGFHPNVAEAKASAIAVCCGSTGFTFPNRIFVRTRIYPLRTGGEGLNSFF